MQKTPVSNALPNQIQHLLEQRAQHIAALATIEETLARVSAALGGAVTRTPASHSPTAPAPKRRGRPKGGSSGLTANEFVLDFVRRNGNPTSQEISKAWKSAGRNGSADNALSVLSKTGKLKREALGVGIRGSRYATA